MSNTAEKVQRSCFDFLREAMHQAQLKPKSDRTEVDCHLIKVYFRPVAFGGKGPTPLGVGSTPAPDESVITAASTVAMDTTPDTSAPSTNQGSKIIQPHKKASLACYTKWLLYLASQGKFPPGLVVFKDGSISMRSVRGFRFLYCRSPSNRKGAAPAHRHRYQLHLVELILTPNYYESYVSQNLIFYPAPQRETSFEGDPNNFTLDDVAEFLRRECVTIEEVQNSALWALQWLATVQYADIDSRLEVVSHTKLYPQLEAQGIPAGFNENLCHPDGSIELCPSYPNSNIYHLTEPPIIPHNGSNAVPTSTDTDSTMSDAQSSSN
ncbi:hypothetical protein AAF712_013708 [Marasmius tenuissimus]|uniref:Uncharacterized protein n=1 Tax=Marasmius tenuissimus TaxID=585030 RepID=A0ABR2ZGE1_9AGAR